MSNHNNNKRGAVAKVNKADEFYTRLEDIEIGCQPYLKYFENKIIYCNCDDYNISFFVKYFQDNFHNLKLKKFISTGYNKNGNGYYSEFDGENIITKNLQGNGDFRSDECMDLLKQSDIIITNPPFSLFKEYILTLYEYNKQFLLVGNQMALMYQELFTLFKNNKLFLGKGFKGYVGFFYSDYQNIVNKRNLFKEGCIRVAGITWYTNLPTELNPFLELTKKYNENDYPIYDNYNVIEVNKTKNIPYDYDGIMGVPITFLYKYNPNQFEIIGLSYSWDNSPIMESIRTDQSNRNNAKLNGKLVYTRVFIKNKTPLIN